MTLCNLRAATVLSRDCRADFGRPLTKKVMSHSRDGPGITAPSRTNIVPLTGVSNPPPPSVTPPPLKSPRQVWVRFGSVSGPVLGSVSGRWVGSGRGASVREKNITTLGTEKLTEINGGPRHKVWGGGAKRLPLFDTEKDKGNKEGKRLTARTRRCC